MQETHGKSDMWVWAEKSRNTKNLALVILILWKFILNNNSLDPVYITN